MAQQLALLPYSKVEILKTLVSSMQCGINLKICLCCLCFVLVSLFHTYCHQDFIRSTGTLKLNFIWDKNKVEACSSPCEVFPLCGLGVFARTRFLAISSETSCVLSSFDSLSPPPLGWSASFGMLESVGQEEKEDEDGS